MPTKYAKYAKYTEYTKSMLKKQYDVIVIGGGAAGMAAADTVHQAGYKVAVIEREERLGGILLQCIHNGFGLHTFKKELTGPEYAEEYCDKVAAASIDAYANTTVVDIQSSGKSKTVVAYSKEHGVLQFKTKSVVLAMGCRERNRGNIGIPGTRPSGVFTAGLAQRLLNIEGYLPGKEIVIVGSGDIGLIMARRLSWVGANVKCVVEIMPHPSGITRNIVQCLHDFNIPLYLRHGVTKIYGKDRVQGVDISPLESGIPVAEKTFHVDCDTVLLSVGLIPENELSRKAGVLLNHDTSGPRVDADLQTSVPGIFACGNVLHVHDLVDFVTEESVRCGENVVRYLEGALSGKKLQIPAVAGSNIKYVIPNQCIPERDSHFFMRAMIVREHAELSVQQCGKKIYSKKLRHVKPAEMISLVLKKKDLEKADKGKEIEFSIE